MMLRPVRWMLCKLNAGLMQAEREAYEMRQASDDHIRKLARSEALRVSRDARRADRRRGVPNV